MAVYNLWRRVGEQAMEFLKRLAIEESTRVIKEVLKGEKDVPRYKEAPEVFVVFAAPPDPRSSTPCWLTSHRSSVPCCGAPSPSPTC